MPATTELRSGGAPASTPAPTRVKICGITSPADAELAAGLGAWAVGMVFHPGSPRRCSADAAREIAAALRRRVETCGVWVNASLEEIERSVEELGLTLVQLHGDEGPAFCAEVRRRTGARVIKAAQVSTAGDVRALDRYHVDFHLLDARSSRPSAAGLRGGTGETFDWALAASRRSRVPLILSGGLAPANVAGAIAAVRPFAVDTASGTEAAPGRKDGALLHGFFDAVAEADAERAAAAAAADALRAARAEPAAAKAAATEAEPPAEPGPELSAEARAEDDPGGATT